MLTNGNADIYRFEIGRYFKFSISSLEAKDNKPNRSHFDKASKKLKGIKFDEMLHIGDHQINDIIGANNLGINTLWFNNNSSEWEHDSKKPDEFSSWKMLPEIIEKYYG